MGCARSKFLYTGILRVKERCSDTETKRSEEAKEGCVRVGNKGEAWAVRARPEKDRERERERAIVNGLGIWEVIVKAGCSVL